MEVCCVPHCDNTKQRLSEFSEGLCSVHKCVRSAAGCSCLPPFTIFQFPREPSDRKRWIEFLRTAGESAVVNVMPTSGICSDHFVDGKPTDVNPDPTLAANHVSDGATHRARKRKLTDGSCYSEEAPISDIQAENDNSIAIKAEVLPSAAEGTSTKLPQKTPESRGRRRGRPAGRCSQPITIPLPSPLPSPSESMDNTADNSSEKTGRRNKCTSAAVLLGLNSRRKRQSSITSPVPLVESPAAAVTKKFPESRKKMKLSDDVKLESPAAAVTEKLPESRKKMKLSDDVKEVSVVDAAAAEHSASETNLSAPSSSASKLSLSSLQDEPSTVSSSFVDVRTRRRENLVVSPEWLKPFADGWHREIVHRSTSTVHRPAADVYYFSPQNVKLRSQPELADYLIRTKSDLQSSNFTFIREPIYEEPSEIVRLAGFNRPHHRLKPGTTPSSVTSSASASPVPTDDLSRKASDKADEGKEGHVKTVRRGRKPLSAGQVQSGAVTGGHVLLPTRRRLGRPRSDASDAAACAVKMFKHRWGSSLPGSNKPTSGMLLKIKLPSLQRKSEAQAVTVSSSPESPSKDDAKSSTAGESSSWKLLKTSPRIDLRKHRKSIKLTVDADREVRVEDVFDDDDSPMLLDAEDFKPEKATNATPVVEDKSTGKEPSHILIRAKQPVVSSAPSSVVVVRPSGSPRVQSSNKPKMISVVANPRMSTGISAKSSSSTASFTPPARVLSAGASPGMQVVRLQLAAKTSQQKSPLVVTSQVVKSKPADLTVKTMLEKKRSGVGTSLENLVISSPKQYNVKANAAGVLEQRLCNVDCPGRNGVQPSLYCDMCMCLFHPQCVGLYNHYGWISGFTCWPCRCMCKQLLSTKYLLNNRPLDAPDDDKTPTTPAAAAAASDEQLKADKKTNKTKKDIPVSTESLSRAGSSSEKTGDDILPADKVAHTTAETSIVQLPSAASVNSAVSESLVSKTVMSTGCEPATAVGSSDSSTLVSKTDDSGLRETSPVAAAASSEPKKDEKVADGTPTKSQDELIKSDCEVVAVSADPVNIESSSSSAAVSEMSSVEPVETKLNEVSELPTSTVSVEVKASSTHPTSPPASVLSDTIAVSTEATDALSVTDITTSSSSKTVSTTLSVSMATSCAVAPCVSDPRLSEERQTLTLPLSILSYINTSQPVRLVVAGRCIAVPRRNISTVTTGLLLFLPAHSLPDEYAKGRGHPLVCQVVSWTRDPRVQLIVVALPGEDPLKTLENLEMEQAVVEDCERGIETDKNGMQCLETGEDGKQEKNVQQNKLEGTGKVDDIGIDSTQMEVTGETACDIHAKQLETREEGTEGSQTAGVCEDQKNILKSDVETTSQPAKADVLGEKRLDNNDGALELENLVSTVAAVEQMEVD